MKVEIIKIGGKNYIKAWGHVGRYYADMCYLRRLSKKLTGAEIVPWDWDSAGIFTVGRDPASAQWIRVCCWVGITPKIFFFPELVRGKEREGIISRIQEIRGWVAENKARASAELAGFGLTLC